jgi:hypothetical protein
MVKFCSLFLLFIVICCGFFNEVKAEVVIEPVQHFGKIYILTPSMKYLDITQDMMDGETETLLEYGDKIYLGLSGKFCAFDILVGYRTAPIPGEEITISVWKGRDWSPVTVIDGTYLASYQATMLQDGPVGWCFPRRWVKNTVEGNYYYWIEVDFGSTLMVAISEITVKCSKF